MNQNFLLKRDNFLQLQNFVHTPPQAATQGKSCLLMRQPDNYLQFAKVGTRKGMDVI